MCAPLHSNEANSYIPNHAKAHAAKPHVDAMEYSMIGLVDAIFCCGDFAVAFLNRGCLLCLGARASFFLFFSEYTVFVLLGRSLVYQKKPKYASFPFLLFFVLHS